MWLRTSKKKNSRGHWKYTHHLRCDECSVEFTRNSELARNRRKAGVLHFCPEHISFKRFNAMAYQSKVTKLVKRIGDVKVGSNGYMEMYVGTSHRRRMHIIVMEQHLGRFLDKGEVVHHIDGNKTNNDINNLHLMTRDEHNACHGKIEGVVFQLYKSGVVGYDRDTRRYFVR